MSSPSALGPNLAFVLTIFGILLLYCEFIWIGKIVPGLLGALLVMFGAYQLWQMRPTALGLELIAAAVSCFAVEARFRTYYMAGIAGTALLGCGFWKLYNQPPWIVAGLSFPMSGLLGAATTSLLAIARRARRNKRNLSQ